MKNVTIVTSQNIVLTVHDFVGLMCNAVFFCLKYLDISSLKSGDFMNG